MSPTRRITYWTLFAATAVLALVQVRDASRWVQSPWLGFTVLAGGELQVRQIDDASQPGSGSSPDVYLPTPVVRVTSAPWSAEELASRLRHGEPPVFARIHEDRLLLDPRTLLPGDAGLLLEAFRALAS